MARRGVALDKVVHRLKLPRQGSPVTVVERNDHVDALAFVGDETPTELKGALVYGADDGLVPVSGFVVDFFTQESAQVVAPKVLDGVATYDNGAHVIQSPMP